jgi:hypothetical protein
VALRGADRERLVRVLALEPSVYAEIGDDGAATGQALAIVFGVAAAAGLGHLPAAGLAGGFAASAAWLVAWGVWLVAIHGLAVGLGHESDFARLFRALAYASLPFALAALEWLPLLGSLAWLAKWVAGFAAFTVATRETLGVDTKRAALLCAAGLVPGWLASSIV